jgi:hypothetical protein
VDGVHPRADRISNGAPQSHSSDAQTHGRHKPEETLTSRFGISENNLARRREFARLAEDDRQVLLRLESWADRVAPAMAKEFYDWQFSFGPTLKFFENFAAQRNISLSALRIQLESTQAGYIRSLFSGAQTNWGMSYFEQRLHVGWVGCAT